MTDCLKAIMETITASGCCLIELLNVYYRVKMIFTELNLKKNEGFECGIKVLIMTKSLK